MFLHEFFDFFVFLLLELLKFLSLRFYYLFDPRVDHELLHLQAELRLEAKLPKLRLRSSNFLFVVFHDWCIYLLTIISVDQEIQDLRLTFEFYCQVRMSIEFIDQAHQIADVLFISLVCAALKNPAHVAEDFAC